MCVAEGERRSRRQPHSLAKDVQSLPVIVFVVSLLRKKRKRKRLTFCCCAGAKLDGAQIPYDTNTLTRVHEPERRVASPVAV